VAERLTAFYPEQDVFHNNSLLDHIPAVVVELPVLSPTGRDRSEHCCHRGRELGLLDRAAGVSSSIVA
jgi:hypothetical protein